MTICSWMKCLLILSGLSLALRADGECLLPPPSTPYAYFSMTVVVEWEIVVYFCPNNLTFLSNDTAIVWKCLGGNWNASVNSTCGTVPQLPCSSSSVTPPNALALNLTDSSSNMVAYECIDGYSWLSGDAAKISQCKGGKWTSISDICEPNCVFPRDCGDVSSAFGFNSNGYYNVNPSGELSGSIYLVFCILNDSPSNNGGNWTYIFSNNMSDMIYTSSDYITGINQWGNSNYFVGLQYLSSRSISFNGSVPGMVLEVRFFNSSTNLIAWATYSNFTVGSKALNFPITSLGVYHGSAGDALSALTNKPFQFSYEEALPQWWGATSQEVPSTISAINGSFLTLGGTWSTINSSVYANITKISMRIRQPLQDSAKYCRPMIGFEPWWTATSVNVPYSRRPGTKLSWQCEDVYYYEGTAGQSRTQSGMSICMNGTRPFWSYNVTLPCTFVCPERFVKSVDERTCFYYSTDTASGITQAASKCIALNATLALFEQPFDLNAARPNVYYLTAYSSRGQVVTSVVPPLPSTVLTTCSTNQCTATNGYECSVIQSPANYGFVNCNATFNYACQIHDICPRLDYLPAKGGCYKVVNATTFYEALTLCAADGASLAYPTTIFQSQSLVNLLTKIVSELSDLGDNGPQLFFVGVNNYNSNWTGAGEYGMGDLFPILSTGLSSLNWRTLRVYPEAVYAFEPADITAVIPEGKAICQLFGRLECQNPAPAPAGNMSVSYNGSVLDGAISTYNCYPGYFYNRNISQNFTQSICYGLLGGQNGWIPPIINDCVTLPVCSYGEFTFGSPYILSSVSNPESFLLNGTITFTCPLKMSFSDGSLQKNATCMQIPFTSNYSFSLTNISCSVCLGSFSVINATYTKSPTSSSSGNLLGDKMVVTCEPGFEYAKYQTVQVVECTGIGWNTSSVQNCYRTCSNGTPPVLPTDNVGSVTVVSNSSINGIGTYYLYQCIPGYYFVLTKGFPKVVNASFAMCADTGHWLTGREPLQCLRMCTTPPPAAPKNTTSNWEGSTQTINTTVTYTAESEGVFLNLSSSWTIICNGTFWLPIDYSSMLPFGRINFQLLIACSNSPPASVGNSMPVNLPKGNGFVNDQINYLCPSGMQDISGLMSITLSCSSTTQKWTEPPANILCQNLCLQKPVAPPKRTKYNYTGEIGKEGDVIQYRCVGGFIWGYVATLNSTCTNNNWTINYIPKCLPVTTLGPSTQPPYVLPETMASSTKYQDTADLSYSDISQSFKPISGEAVDVLTVQSLFGFGYAVGVRSQLKQCMVNQNFASNSSSCENNPANCLFGLSFSIWARVYFSDDAFNMISVGPEDNQYLLSTGGDDNGNPGVAIGVRKQDLFAIVSTGIQYWQVYILGPVPNDTWTNIGISWNKDNRGLKVFVNNVQKGYQPTPQMAPAVLPPIDPPTLLIGCQKSSSQSNYTGFATADVDEAAFWTKTLGKYETDYFLGGYDGNLTTLESPEQFQKVLSHVYLKDMTQREAAINMFAQHTEALKYCFPSQIVTQNAETAIFDNSYLNSAPASVENTTDFMYLGMILEELFEEKNLPDSISPADALVMMKTAESFSNLLSACHLPAWLNVQNETENVGVIQLISKFKKWNEKLAQNLNITDVYPFCHEQIEHNIYIKFCKMTVGDLMAMGERIEIPDYSSPSLQSLRDMWSDVLIDRVSAPTSIFYDDTCEDRLVTFIVHYYDHVQNVIHTLVNPMNIDNAKNRAINSRLLSVSMVVDPGRDNYQDYDPTLPKCLISNYQLQQETVAVKLEHTNRIPSSAYSRSLQQLVFPNTSDINMRVCVWWNDALSDFGSWDNKGCAMAETTDQYSKCSCQDFGIFAILALQNKPMIVPAEPFWLHLLRHTLYIISAFAICLYIIVVLVSSDLKDQLHLIGLNLATAILVGSIAMIFTDMEQVKNNRNACTLLGSLIHLFYGGVGAWMIGLGHASFKAITAGVIGGHLGGYMSICWGIAIAFVGIPFITLLPEIGTDPRCFIGWDNEVKLVFFLPQMFFCMLALILAIIILCNLSVPALRKENLIDDYGSFCYGAALLLIFLSFTWTFGLLAYVRFSFYFNGPNFYPIFQVLNASSGVCLFIFIGLGSNRFKTALRGQAAIRHEMLRKYAFGLPAVPLEQDHNKE